MRIISQTGADIPYDDRVISQRFDCPTEIMAFAPQKDEGFPLGNYASFERAREVMSEIRANYANWLKCQFRIPTDEFDLKAVTDVAYHTMPEK